VLNRAPYFLPGLVQSFNLNLAEVINQPLPGTFDPDGHSPTVTGSATQPSFISLTAASLTISPTLCSEVTTHTFDIIVSDTNKQSTYTITTTVNNRPPEYKTPFSYPSMTIALNSVGK
jgi:hypothetical protein